MCRLLTVDLSFLLFVFLVIKSKYTDISFKQEVFRGTHHTHEPEIFEKKDYQQSHRDREASVGCSVTGEVITDKVGGNFMLITKGLPNPSISENHGNEAMFRFQGYMQPHEIPPDLRYFNIHLHLFL